MAQFDGLLPRFTYSTGPSVNLDFTRPPKRQETYTEARTLEMWAPEADTATTDEFVADHIYMFDFVMIRCQHILDSEYTDFLTWWKVIRNGQQFTYYPDKDVGGTSFTVIKAMDNFEPTRTSSMWYFDITLRIIA